MSTTILDSGVRRDLVDAHRNAMAAIGAVGTWWTSAQRLAIAAEVRRAGEHTHLAPWDAPSSIDGLIAADHPLPAAAVDAVWRLSNHPGTLTQAWHAEIVAALPGPEHYVELVSIVAMLNGIDQYAKVMAIDPIPLPQPVDGTPTEERVDGAAVRAHWVPTADIGGANVLKALSAVPADRPAFQALSDAQYVPGGALLGDLGWGRSGLDRRQIELVAAQTSMVNECFY